MSLRIEAGGLAARREDPEAFAVGFIAGIGSVGAQDVDADAGTDFTVRGRRPLVERPVEQADSDDETFCKSKSMGALPARAGGGLTGPAPEPNAGVGALDGFSVGRLVSARLDSRGRSHSTMLAQPSDHNAARRPATVRMSNYHTTINRANRSLANRSTPCGRTAGP